MAARADLYDAASALLEKRYAPPVHSVAAALLSKDGQLFTALNIDHFTMFVCAETAALSAAINQGVYEFDGVVAVRKNQDGVTSIANMCGKCRQIFHDYAPGIVVTCYDAHDETRHDEPIENLLPFAFTRQKEKIQSVLEGARVS